MEFKREERYVVFKVSDPGNSLKGDEIRKLAEEYAEYRKQRGKEPLECVVVEKDWPEYEPTWQAIEARVTGAQAQPAPKAVAYLDLGVGGYTDIGTDLTDEELTTLPKGRHMLGIIGTYGVDGYVPAQPAPSVPNMIKKITRGFRWCCEKQHHVPTLEIEFEPVPANSPCDAKGWQDRDRLAKMLAAAPEAKPCP